ncbi:MAG: lysophospholipid acyltransferase family protein [Salibacteraceae bacterium]
MNIGVPIIKTFSRLPWGVLYKLSTFFYWLVFRLIGYRKEVVNQNLRNSFPNKTNAEIQQISNDFFRFLADMFIESFKAITMSEEDWKKGFKTTNVDLPNSYYDKGQSIVTVLGHYGNWEYLVTAYSRDTKHTVLGVYKPLSDPDYEKLLAQYRTRYGMVLVPLYDAYDIIKEYTDRDEKIAIMLIGDQTPHKDRGYWMDFLNQDTPVFRGAEKLAKQYNFPVLFATLDQTARGQYSMSFETVFDNPRETEEGEITEFHTKKLEKQIQAKPHLWLWSHKRWKHKRPADTPERFISKRFPGQ